MLDCGALLFDLDGLMVDSEPVWFEVQSDFVRARGGAWTAELARACVGRGLDNSLVVMNEAFGFAVDPERDVEAMVEGFLARVQSLALKPGCRELIEAALDRGLGRAVASSSTARLVEATLHRFQLWKRFDAIVTGDQVRRAKPSPDIFLAAAEGMGASPSECVVLEDSLAGVQAARAAGMRVIAVPEGEPAPFVGLADAVVHDLYAARKLLAI